MGEGGNQAYQKTMDNLAGGRELGRPDPFSTGLAEKG